VARHFRRQTAHSCFDPLPDVAMWAVLSLLDLGVPDAIGRTLFRSKIVEPKSHGSSGNLRAASELWQIMSD
jgi:hypothetical protein